MSAPTSNPLARRTDPSTSKQAASMVVSNGRQQSLKQLVMEALADRDGMTSGEIADHLGLSHDKVWRRVSDLKNDRSIYSEGTRTWHGRSQQVWWLRPRSMHVANAAPEVQQGQLWMRGNR